MRLPKRATRLAVALFTSALLLAALAASATAAPSAPVMSLTELNTKLASGSIHGYMKTVLQGSDIATIAVNVLAVTDGINRPSDGAILFESTGTVIDSFGGIVAGMSGSPIYISNNGTDTVIGAVAYSDSDTLGGLGLATPIMNMLQIRSKYAPAVARLRHPVITSQGVIDRVVVTDDTSTLSGTTADRAAVVRPLASPLFIGGIPQNSRLFTRVTKLAEKAGRRAIAVGQRSASAPSPGSASLVTTLEPGASVAAHEARGDLLFAGFGTVTYTDSETVLAYGHPNTQRGNSCIYMSNAWIDGIWKKSDDPYKLARLGALRGTITQDRDAGIMGVTGQFPTETTITAEAVNADTLEETSTKAYMPRGLLNTVPTGDEYDQEAAEELPAYCTFPAGAHLFDQDHTPGSALTTTTIHVRNTVTDATHTITMPNCIDDSFDIPSAIIWDAEEAMSSIRSLLDDNVEHFEVLDIDVQSRIAARRNFANVTAVNAPSALHVGANRVNVSVLAYGVAETQTIPATVTIPAGVSTTGYLAVTSSESGRSLFPTDESMTGGSSSSSSSRSTLSEIVDSLNKRLPGNGFTIRYTPISTSASDDDEEEDEDSSTTKSIVTTGTTQWTLDGSALASPILLAASLEETVIDCGGDNYLEGEVINGPDEMGPISLFATPAGGTESLVETTTANAKTDEFAFELYGLTKNTTLRLHVDGVPSEGYMPTDKTIMAYVRPRLTFRASSAAVTTGRRITLSANVWPSANAGAKIRFEYNSGGRWRTITTKTLSSSAKTSASWKVIKGSHKVRARFLGSAYNAASISGTKTVKGK